MQHRLAPIVMAPVLASLLVACSTSSVLAPPSDIPTGSISGLDEPAQVSEPFAPAPPMASALPESTGVYGAQMPTLAPASGSAALASPAPSQMPSFETLASASDAPMLAPPPRSLGTLTMSGSTGEPLGAATSSAPAGDSYSPIPGLGTLQGERPLPADERELAALQSQPANGALQTSQARPASGALQQDANLSPDLVPPPGQGEVAPRSQPAPVAVAAPEPEDEPRRLAGLIPRGLNPFGGGREEAASGIPAEEAACQRRLERLGVQFRTKPAVGNGGSCGIAHPVEISGLSGNIRVAPATTLNCRMAEAFATWVKDELAPGVRKRYIAGIDTIGSMGGYSCRTMNSRRGAPMSEHASGNAIDIGSLKLNTGKTITVRKKGFFAFRERGLLNTVRDDGCQHFTTILGPGSDRNHADHFHFDLRERRNGYRHCD